MVELRDQVDQRLFPTNHSVYVVVKTKSTPLAVSSNAVKIGAWRLEVIRQTEQIFELGQKGAVTAEM